MYGLNLQGNVAFRHTLKPAARTATATGTTVTMKDGDKCDIIFDLGTWTDGVHTFSVESAPSTAAGAAGTFAPVPVADLYDRTGILNGSGHLVVDAAPEDDAIITISYVGGDDWIRVVQTITGSPATGMVAGVVIAVHLLRAVGNTPLASSAKW